jgi:NTP pyrophosphatase (non-canonical NTP hydrolase)
MIDTFYGKFVNTMFKNIPHENDVDNYLNDFGLIHAATGIAGEAGEILDLTKKIVFTGKKYAREDLIREMGDLEFYIEALRQQTGITRQEVLEENWRKLSKRHGNRAIEEHYSEN